jgi:hypothetical protein
MKIEIQFIPHANHKHTTIGYWYVENDTLTIQISEEICWENRVAVLFHELIESAWCISKGITTAECDAFDDMFELEYASGLWPKSVEAGFDKRCPYRKGHVWGSRFEKLVLWILGADKKACDAECDALMGVE